MLKTRATKLLLICGLSLLFVSVAVLVCVHLAQTVFFDKFFFQKSEYFGYSGYDESLVYSPRNADLYHFGLLTDQHFSFPQEVSTQNNQEDEYFAVAVIGDSFAWGQGVTKKKRLSVQLQQKLNRWRPTRVYSLGLPAESIVDAVAKIEAVTRKENVDLFVIPAVQNDALLLPEANYNRYSSPTAQAIIDDCHNLNPTLPVRTSPDWRQVPLEDMAAVAVKLEQDTHESWTVEPNRCMIKASLQRIKELSKGKVLFVITDDYTPEQSLFGEYKALLKEAQLPFISSLQLKNDPRYQKYWQNPGKFFHVSPRELHPSALAYGMYADLITAELLTNPLWKFQ